MKKAMRILLEALPILAMIALIPLVQNDYLLALLYAAIIAVALAVKRGSKDLLILVFGFFAMIVSEYFFVSTGVEHFNRNSLLGVMPLWLPLLWAYGFVAIKRGIEIIS